MWQPFKRDKDPFAAARYSDIVKSVRKRERDHMRYWWQWALLGFFVLLILLGAFGLWRYFELQCKISCGGPDPKDTGGKPFNVLLVGSDSRAGLTREEQLDLGAGAISGERADTLILAHVDPDTDRVIMVQFPRDLYVPIVGNGSNKINSALLYGPAKMIKTVEQLTHLDIHRYAKIDIRGFRDLVDAIGGVEICLTEPIPFDPQTGLEVTHEEVPGLVKFDGDRALRFVRSRHYATGDFERIQNQQKFVAAALDKISSSETLLHPSRLFKLVDVAGKHLRANMSIPELRDLASTLQFDPERYEAYTVPNLGTASNEAGSVVLPNMPVLNMLFEALKNNESPAEADGVPNVEPSTVRVGVYNGSFVDGIASAVAAELQAATITDEGAVDIVEIANADRPNYGKTLVGYRPEAKMLAELVAAAMPQAKLKEGKTRPGVDVAVIVGEKGYETRRIVQINPIPLPRPGEVPKQCRR